MIVATTHMKEKCVQLILGLATSVALWGCGTLQVDPTKVDSKSVIPTNFALPSVRLSTKLTTLEDSVDQMGGTYNVQTGKVFRQVFTGGENAPNLLDIVNSTLSQSSSDVMLLLTSTNVTYTASVVLKMTDGRKQTFSATGTASRLGGIVPAIREAVERAVIDLGKQIQSFLQP